MTKIKALEKVFAAEVDGRLPFQSKAAIYRKLCDEGLIEPMSVLHRGRYPVRIEGYQLTHAGRIMYCASCG